MLNATPRFSFRIFNKFFPKAPVPADKESPIAATTLISPGLNLWTLFGLYFDGFKYLHGNISACPSNMMHCLRLLL